MSARWRSLAALTLARAGMGFQFQAVAAVAPLISADLHLDKAQLGWLIGLYLLPGVAFALPGGLLGRRFGDRRMVLAGLVLMGLGGLWLAAARTLEEASAARVLCGAGAAILNVLMTKMVTDLFDGRERLLAMSILINSWPVGIGVALLVIGPLAELAGWRWGLGAAVAFAALGFVLVAAVYRSPAAAPQPATSRIGLDMLTRREWQLLAVGSLPWLLYNAAYQIVISFLPSFLVGSGWSIARAGSLVALNTAMFVVGVQAGGVVLKRARRPELVCHATLLAWCATLLFIAAGSVPWPWLVIGGLLGGIPAAALVSLPGEFLRPDSRSAGMGVFFTIYYLGCASLPALAGRLYDASGGGAALGMAVVLVIVATLALALFRRVMTAPDRLRPMPP